MRQPCAYIARSSFQMRMRDTCCSASQAFNVTALRTRVRRAAQARPKPARAYRPGVSLPLRGRSALSFVQEEVAPLPSLQVCALPRESALSVRQRVAVLMALHNGRVTPETGVAFG